MDGKIRKGMSNRFEEYPYKQITSNEIERLGYKWFNRQEIPYKLQEGCYLLNLDDLDGPGSHWTTFIISRPYLFYIDPFGNNIMAGYPPKEIIKHAQNNDLKLIVSPYWIQFIKSWECGYISLYLCDLFDDYIGRLTPKFFHQLMKEHFYPDGPDVDDVIKVNKWSKSKSLM